MFTLLPVVLKAIFAAKSAYLREEEIDEILKKFNVSTESLAAVMNLLRKDMDNGLSADPSVRAQSPLKMVPTFVRKIPDGSETGDFLALDLGGTNFRVLLVQIYHGEVHIESDIFPLDQDLMTSDAVMLFDYIADCIEIFVRKRGIQNKILPLGFTFSFPVNQLSLTSGLLIRWTKGFTAKNVEGEDVVKLMNEALQRKGISSVEVVALVNDTTGTMMSCGLSEQSVCAGLILGTGTNVCYMEKLENVGKWTGDKEGPDQVVINTEWGAFGDNGSLKWIRTEYDETIDRDSLNPGEQLFEKMISGMYLGEIVRLVCVDLADKGILFSGSVSEKFRTKGSFQTKFVSDVESHERKKLVQVLDEMEVNGSERDKDILQMVCEAVSLRAARLAAAGLATIIKKTNSHRSTMAIDGSLFKKHPQFKCYMQSAMFEVLPECNTKLMMSKDGSGKGAALVAAVAVRMKSK